MIRRIDIENGAGYSTDLHEVGIETGEYVYSGDVASVIEQAFMAGQAACGVDPSFSMAQAYAAAKLRNELK